MLGKYMNHDGLLIYFRNEFEWEKWNGCSYLAEWDTVATDSSNID